MTGKELRQAVRNGERVYGTCVTSPSPVWPAMLAGTGLDFVFIDTEHIPLDRSQVSWMCQTFDVLGLPPIVRIPKCDAALANAAIDGGARGIVSPYVESVEEIDILRGATKYRPLKGRRLKNILAGDETLDEPTRSYIEKMNRHNLCIVNIESVAALEKLHELASVPDVDAFLIGPHDLSVSMDMPEEYGRPEFTRAIERIIESAKAAGIGVGFHYSFGLSETLRWAEMGANLIIHSSDYFLVKGALTEDIRSLRASLGDDASSKSRGDRASTDSVII